MFKLFFCVLAGVVGYDLAGAVQFVFVDDESLETVEVTLSLVHKNYENLHQTLWISL